MSRLLIARLRIISIILFVILLVIPKTTFAQSAIDLVVHYVEGAPAENEIAYNVNVYLSVVDGVGNPIKDLIPSSLTVTEDSQAVQITNLNLVKDEPIHIVLAMDVSGSMSGAGVSAAKTAASNFISGLGVDDSVAIVTFDDNVKTKIDFTTDHAAVLNQLALVDAVRGAGTCLYDAAYQSIQMASTLPSGRRAVILFTDGVDETYNGGICSTHTSGDVIKIASDGGTRTPIYSLGMGGRIDENTLKRMAELTGGRYLNSPDSTQLDAVFLRLSDQLRSQYILTYKSLAGPGAHTLAVSVKNSSSQDSDTRNFLLPAMSTHITFTTPLEGESVSGTVKLVAATSGQSEPLAGVTFEVNGQTVGTDTTFPYELDINLDPYPIGNLTLSAVVYGLNNTELTRRSIVVVHNSAEPVSINPTQIPLGPNSLPIPMAGIGGLIVVVIVIVIIIILLLRQRKKGTIREESYTEDPSFDYVKTYVGDYGEDASPVKSTNVKKEDVSFDYAKTHVGDYGEEAPVVTRSKTESDVFGSLIVEASDDASMIGHRFDITTVLTTLGRSADNDITFPKDNPVSRHHAEISEKRGMLYLMELRQSDISGESKSPKFGTFINEIQLGPNPVLLHNNDVIGLGKRLRLKFETSMKISGEDAATFDDLDAINDTEKTQD